jgi:hypothetical protein
MFRKRERHTTESDRVWAEGAAAGRAADVNRAKLKEQRLARDAAEKPSTPKGARKQKPPTGTKGEEISSQGQVDERTKTPDAPTGQCEIACPSAAQANGASRVFAAGINCRGGVSKRIPLPIIVADRNTTVRLTTSP